MCWHTAVTVPVVANVLPTYASGFFATSDRAIFGALDSIAAPSFTVPSVLVGAGAAVGFGSGCGSGFALEPVLQAAMKTKARRPNRDSDRIPVPLAQRLRTAW